MITRKRNVHLSALIATMSLMFVLLHTPAAHAELTAADITKIAKKANVLPPTTDVTGYKKGQEVIVSAYVPKSTAESNLKIDAIMLAKEFFDTEPALTRVSINYFDQVDRSTYRSVSVRVTDVKAFGSGVVSKDELLGSISVETHKNAAPSAKPAAAKAPAGYQRFEKFGMSFYYPSDWIAVEGSLSDDPIVTIKSNSNSAVTAKIELKKEKANSPEAAYKWGLSMRDYMIGKQNRAMRKTGNANAKRLQPINVPPTLKFGVGNAISGLQLAAYYNMTDNDTGIPSTRFDRVIYFGWPANVYALRVRSENSDASLANQIFTTLLSSVSIGR